MSATVGNFVPVTDKRNEISMAAPQGPGLGLTDNVYASLLANRIIFLGSEVRDENANAICAQMLLLNAEDPHSDIYLYINSPGGSVDSGMAIFDTMQWISNDVATVAMGLAASMGQFLLSAGTPGKRYALPHSRIMMHQPSGGLGGTASDIRIQAEQSLHIKKTMAKLIAQVQPRSAGGDGDPSPVHPAPRPCEGSQRFSARRRVAEPRGDHRGGARGD